MKLNILILTFVLLSALCSLAAAQNGDIGSWTRVQSDNGEFSIEVPEDFSYFFDSDGFIVGEDQRDYPVREMNLLNAYLDETLISFEVYRADPDAMTALLKSTLDHGGGKSSKTRFHGIEVREVVKTNDRIFSPGQEFYFVSRYFKSKEFVYILTGLSRQGETAIIKRFFESLKFAPGAGTLLPGVRRFGELKISPIEIKVVEPPPQPDKSAGVLPKPAAPDPDYKQAIIASKTRASYVKRARDNDVQGAVRLRLVLNEKGYFPNIDVMRTLPDGLVRQAIFAALRIKFLPARKGGKEVPIRKILEYTFSIY